MGTYYVDPAAGGANNGSSWGDAWTSIQSAFDNCVAADVCYCRGTQTIAAALDIDTNSGSKAAGFIKFIGCNGAGNRDGTRFVIDCNGNAIIGLNFAGFQDLSWFENFEVKNNGGSSEDGINIGAGCDGHVFVNCSFHDFTGHGVVSFGSFHRFIRCTSYNNDENGFQQIGNSVFAFCSAHDNGQDGFDVNANGMAVGCIAYGNSEYGFDGFENTDNCIFCSADGNTLGGFRLDPTASIVYRILIGCRSTNHSAGGAKGVDGNGEPLMTLGCYFEDNDGNNIQGHTVHENVSIDGTSASSNAEDQGDTNEGYTDLTPGSEDFNLRSDATLRRQGINIPID